MDEQKLKYLQGRSYVGITTCFFCHDGNGHIFMARRSQKARDEKGKWDIGGGGLDFGLTAEENVAKEIEEEYSAKPIDITFLGYRDVFRTHDDVRTHWLALDFAARVSKDDVKISEPDMFDDSGWFSLNDLPVPLHSQNAYTFEKNLDALRNIIG